MSDNRVYLPGESEPDQVLSILEVPCPEGGVRFRISRYCSADGARWVRHGLFVMFHGNEKIALQGEYRDGLEEGLWQTRYEDGQLAAEGCYIHGKQHGYWRFWQRDGTEQPPAEYVNGED